MSITQAYAHKVAQMPKLQHAAVRVGLWIAVVAEKTGGFPVNVHHTNMMNGYNKDGVTVPGICFRPPTVRQSLAALQEAGILTVVDIESRYAHPMKSCTLNL
jgi:hypothetical protein